MPTEDRKSRRFESRLDLKHGAWQKARNLKRKVLSTANNTTFDYCRAEKNDSLELDKLMCDVHDYINLAYSKLKKHSRASTHTKQASQSDHMNRLRSAFRS